MNRFHNVYDGGFANGYQSTVVLPCRNIIWVKWNLEL